MADKATTKSRMMSITSGSASVFYPLILLKSSISKGYLSEVRKGRRCYSFYNVHLNNDTIIIIDRPISKTEVLIDLR